MQNTNLNEQSASLIQNGVSQNIAECDIVHHEVVALQQQVTKLNEVIVDLQEAMQIKESQLENTHREKNRLLADLKKQQRCNRNLKQQLDDERFYYQREKDHFNEEMQRYGTRYTGNTSRLHQQWRKEVEEIQDTLEAENKQLKEEMADKSEITYNLCIKFLRMKHAKDTLRYKLDQLLHEHLLVMAEMMEKLDEARKELNLIVSEKFQEPLSLNKAKFVQIVQRNNRLMYENATLKIQVHQLTQNIEKLKNYVQKPKKINIDAKIIEKLSMQCSTRSSVDKTEKIALLSKMCQSVDYSEGMKVVSRAYSKDGSNCTFSGATEVRNDSTKFRTERAESAPGIVETVSRQNG